MLHGLPLPPAGGAGAVISVPPPLSCGAEGEPRRLLPNVRPVAGFKNVKILSWGGLNLAKRPRGVTVLSGKKKKAMRSKLNFRALVGICGSLKRSGYLKRKSLIQCQREAVGFEEGVLC